MKPEIRWKILLEVLGVQFWHHHTGDRVAETIMSHSVDIKYRL